MLARVPREVRNITKIMRWLASGRTRPALQPTTTDDGGVLERADSAPGKTKATRLGVESRLAAALCMVRRVT